MNEGEIAPSWLNEDDREEVWWAGNYLSNRWPPSLQGELSPLLRSQFSDLVSSIRTLESEVEGVKLIERLRNALRQRRYRLSEGGRKTCSFTLPSETKKTLKSLAKKCKTTETALIQDLIESAAQTASEQKEKRHREALINKVVQNWRKLDKELDKIRIDEAGKQLRRCMQQLARWETFLKEEQPELSPEDEAAATALAEQRLRIIKEAINAAVAKHEMMSPRAI